MESLSVHQVGLICTEVCCICFPACTGDWRGAAVVWCQFHKAKQAPCTHLNVTCLFLLCSPFSLCSSWSPCSLNCPDLLLLHCLSALDTEDFPIYFNISCAVLHLQFALPSHHHFSALFPLCNVSTELHHTQ